VELAPNVARTSPFEEVVGVQLELETSATREKGGGNEGHHVRCAVFPTVSGPVRLGPC
jgi:hypothetical protein